MKGTKIKGTKNIKLQIHILHYQKYLKRHSCLIIPSHKQIQIVFTGFNSQQQYCPYGRWPTGYCYSDWDCYYGSYCYRGYGYGYGSGICCPSQKSK